MNICLQLGITSVDAFFHASCLVLLDGLAIGTANSETAAKELRSKVYKLWCDTLKKVVWYFEEGGVVL